MTTNNLFVFWTGSNPLSSARQRCLNSIITTSECNLQLITPENLDSWISYPLHPAYHYLSLTHRSDYLRAYFMHFHGGGYSDIKLNDHSWAPFFQLLQHNESLLMVGYPERRPQDVASDSSYIRSQFSSLPGMGRFIFRPNTELTQRWLSAVHLKLDHAYSLLISSPGNYHPRAIQGGVHQNRLLSLVYKHSKYPFKWNSLLGEVLHPLAYEFRPSLSLALPYPNITNYR